MLKLDFESGEEGDEGDDERANDPMWKRRNCFNPNKVCQQPRDSGVMPTTLFLLSQPHTNTHEEYGIDNKQS